MSEPDDAQSPGYSPTVPAFGTPPRGKSITERLQRLELTVGTGALAEPGAAPPRSLTTSDVVGHYRILGRLGSGGMGYITRALDLRLEREVAIKLAIEPIPSDHEAMLREARALAALNHPNVVTVYEVGEHEGCAYIVMELLRGESLRARLDRARPSLVEALSWACDVLRGLSAVHGARMVHLDIKPENVFLTKDGGPKLIDFGIARHKRTGVQEQSEIVGTIAYMAPEQLLGDPLDFRADIFAFGILLHELVTGRHPFMRSNVAATMHALISGDFFKDGSVAEPEIDAIVRACMELEPRARPPSAAHVLESLERVLRIRTQAVTPSHVTYAETEHGNVALRCIGASQGVDLLVVPGLLSRFDSWPHEPEGAELLHALTDVGRVICFDHAGLGSSDRIAASSLPSPDDEVEHIDAVLDKAGAKRVVLFALDTGAPLAALYAALRPERIAGLVIHAGAPRYTDAEAQARLRARVEGWGTEKNVSLFAPSLAAEARTTQWLSSWERMTASPKTARAWVEAMGRVDVTALLPFLTCPTLVLHRQGDRCCPASESLPFAEHIPGAKRVVLTGPDHLPFAGAADVARHVVEHVRACQAAAPPDGARSLATWIVTDAPVDALPARLHAQVALERGTRRVLRVDRPGAAERAMRSMTATNQVKAVITCSSRGRSPEEVLSETEVLFGETHAGDVAATHLAHALASGTASSAPEAPPQAEPRSTRVSPSSGEKTKAAEEAPPSIREPALSRADTAAPPIPIGKAPPEAPSRKSALIVVAVAAGVAIPTLLFSFPTNRRSEATPPALSSTAAVAPPAHEHTLTLESKPVGATVKEGSDVLGKTPMAITLSPLATETRVFTLSLEGYADYTFRQAPSTADVRFVARLAKVEAEALPVVAPAPPPASATAKRLAAASHRDAPPARSAAPRTPEPARSSAALDIRLNR